MERKTPSKQHRRPGMPEERLNAQADTEGEPIPVKKDQNPDQVHADRPYRRFPAKGVYRRLRRVPSIHPERVDREKAQRLLDRLDTLHAQMARMMATLDQAEETWRKQQREIEALKARLEATS